MTPRGSPSHLAVFFFLVASSLFGQRFDDFECSKPTQRLANFRQLPSGVTDDWDLVTCNVMTKKWVHHYKGAGLPSQGIPRSSYDLYLFTTGGTIPYHANIAWTPSRTPTRGPTWIPGPIGGNPTSTPTRTPTQNSGVVPTAIPSDVIVVPQLPSGGCPAGFALKSNGFCYRIGVRMTEAFQTKTQSAPKIEHQWWLLMGILGGCILIWFLGWSLRK